MRTFRDDDGRDALDAARAGGHSPAVAVLVASTVAGAARGQEPAPVPGSCDWESDSQARPQVRILAGRRSARRQRLLRTKAAAGETGGRMRRPRPNRLPPETGTRVPRTRPPTSSRRIGSPKPESHEGAPAAGSAPCPDAEPAAAATDPALSVEMLDLHSAPLSPADLLWEPEPEPLLAPSKGGIEAAAATLEAGLTRYTASTPDTDWVDTDIGLSETSPAWAANFAERLDLAILTAARTGRSSRRLRTGRSRRRKDRRIRGRRRIRRAGMPCRRPGGASRRAGWRSGEAVVQRAHRLPGQPRAGAEAADIGIDVTRSGARASHGSAPPPPGRPRSAKPSGSPRRTVRD